RRLIPSPWCRAAALAVRERAPDGGSSSRRGYSGSNRNRVHRPVSGPTARLTEPAARRRSGLLRQPPFDRLLESLLEDGRRQVAACALQDWSQCVGGAAQTAGQRVGIVDGDE